MSFLKGLKQKEQITKDSTLYTPSAIDFLDLATMKPERVYDPCCLGVNQESLGDLMFTKKNKNNGESAEHALLSWELPAPQAFV